MSVQIVKNVIRLAEESMKKILATNVKLAI
jgi:hypothetical protein